MHPTDSFLWQFSLELLGIAYKAWKYKMTQTFFALSSKIPSEVSIEIFLFNILWDIIIKTLKAFFLLLLLYPRVRDSMFFLFYKIFHGMNKTFLLPKTSHYIFFFHEQPLEIFFRSKMRQKIILQVEEIWIFVREMNFCITFSIGMNIIRRLWLFLLEQRLSFYFSNLFTHW